MLTTVAHADCPLTQKPEAVFDCLGFITRGLYGAIVNGEQNNEYIHWEKVCFF